jgi:predicted porin
MNKLILAACIAASAASPLTFASDDLRINGFLSVGASMADSDDAHFGGSDDQGGFKNDNVLGLQVSKQINDSTSATGQLVSRGADDYSTEAAWAFVTYAATDDLDLRMGRLRIPFFYYSDFLEIGYAYNWVRPPEEVYRIPFSSVDGIDLTQRFSSGNIDGSVQVYYGRFNGVVNYEGIEYDGDFRNFTGITLSTNMGNFGSRLSYHQAELIMTGPAGSPLNAIGGFGSDFQMTGQTTSFAEAAITYDNGTNSVVAEWTQLDYGTAAFLDDSAWLIAYAHRLGDISLHATYTEQKDVYESGTNGIIQKAAGLGVEESSIILGMRWDYDSSTALKFEVQNNDEETYAGTDGDSAILYSVAVDVVF